MPKPDTSNTRQLVDPRAAYPRPPFPRQSQELPGGDGLLDPKPDHGEESYIGNGRLAGLATIITGSDSGIGKAVAVAFAREGADVLVSYLDEGEDARSTVELIEAEGRRAIPVAGDLQDERHCRRLVERARDEFGRIDILVNNAAWQEPREKIEEIATDEWEQTLRTNLTAPFWLCREALPFMEAGASIINVSSIQATQPSPSLLAYATTKGALVTYSKALSAMLGPRGIRVNVVAPGPIWTPLIPSTFSEEKVETFGSDVPLGRAGQPEEVAPSFVFLASDDSSYMSGQCLHPNGGEVLNG